MAGLTPPEQPGSGPALRFVSNAELNDKERREAEARQNQAPIPDLSAHVNKRWEAAKQNKERVTVELLRCLRQRKGIYDPEELAYVREQGGSEIFMLLTNVKCRGAASWLTDVLIPRDERAFSVDPTPLPDLPPEEAEAVANQVFQEVVAQANMDGQVSREEIVARLEQARDEQLEALKERAKEIADRHEDLIDDQMKEGGWEDAFRGFIDNFVTYPSAFLKGPIPRKRKRLKWADMTISGNRSIAPVVSDEIVYEWECRSPFDIYPSPGARTVQDGYLFDRYRLQLHDLEAMKGMEGFDTAAIESVILEFGGGGLREWITHDHERSVLEGRPNEYLQSSEIIDALNYWGTAPGYMLQQWDPKGDVIGDVDPTGVYDIEVWKIGRWIIKAVLNPDPLGKRPYSGSSFVKVPGSFWGQSIPELVRDDQAMLNAAGRALSNNMGIASGPQVVINEVGRLAEGEEVESLYPWRIWQYGEPKNYTGQGDRKPMEFYQPDALVEELTHVFEFFSRTADEHAALPSYIYGGDEKIQGAGGTASGLAMLMGNASKSLKLVVGNIDKDVIAQRVYAMYVFNMLFHPDPRIKGDLNVTARGASALLVREQRQLRLNEFMTMTNNEIDLRIMGMAGRAELLRETGKDMLDIPVKNVIPDREVLIQQQQMIEQQEEADKEREMQAKEGGGEAQDTEEAQAQEEEVAAAENSAIIQALEGLATGSETVGAGEINELKNQIADLTKTVQERLPAPA